MTKKHAPKLYPGDQVRSVLTGSIGTVTQRLPHKVVLVAMPVPDEFPELGTVLCRYAAADLRIVRSFQPEGA